MSDPEVEIPAGCEVHGDSGRRMVRRADDRVMSDGRADHCCVITLNDPAVTLFDVFGELTGVSAW